jgi:hypothetical protein
MDQNSNYITIEMNLRLSMLCRAPHTICYVKRWIMWIVLAIKLISSLYGHIATHNPEPALPATSISGYSRSTPSPRRE